MYMCIYVYTHICIYVYMYVHMYMYMYMCVYIYIYTHIYTYTSVRRPRSSPSQGRVAANASRGQFPRGEVASASIEGRIRSECDTSPLQM